MKPIQKYPHIVESYASILKIFAAIDKERSINDLIFFGISSTPKEWKWVTLLWTCKANQWVPISEYSSRFIIQALSFILGRLFLEQTPSNLGSFW